MTVAGTTEADDAPLFRWDPSWPHAGLPDYTLTGVGLGDALVDQIFFQSKQPPLHWISPLPFDEAIRSVLRGRTASERSTAANTSAIVFGVVFAFPFSDVPYAWKRFGDQAAWDVFWMDATTASLATSFDLDFRDVVGRARPPVSECLMAGGSRASCLGTSDESTRSFPGGHVMIVTSAATLACTQHLALRLYGPAWDAMACATAITVSAGEGVLRIVADKHWASDIAAGEMLGALFGWGIPALTHLRIRLDHQSVRLLPQVTPLPGGGELGVAAGF
jgi:membrane-associated phospholipid phosphatase